MNLKKYKISSILQICLIWLGVSLVSGFIHEAGHYISSYFLDLQPIMSFENGGFVSYSVPVESIPQIDRAITIASGPVITFILAGLFSLLWKRNKDSLLFLYFAFWNSTFRLNVLIDGAGSDEWKLSSLLNLPTFSFSAISVLISLSFLLFIIKTPTYFRAIHSLWMIPLGWIISMIGSRISFGLIALI